MAKNYFIKKKKDKKNLTVDEETKPDELVMILSKESEYHLISAYQTYINNPDAEVVNNYFHVTDSNPMFIIGYVIVGFVILFAVSRCVLTLLKYLHQKKQPKVDLSKVVIHE